MSTFVSSAFIFTAPFLSVINDPTEPRPQEAVMQRRFHSPGHLSFIRGQYWFSQEQNGTKTHTNSR
jgi:hypothetical protein